ncbi:MAG: Heme sensor protein HssS [candidate division WS6 bacterium OLB20]|uniref:histidine kinase n=1 Tax=candidate division WS6 bacterium OLB20 TaxID=1617426 RepID=A0A136LZ43_9BACT|nr:MAG: Heme sensor protein HssS [candidate division WS6 bacterium OLB20]
MYSLVMNFTRTIRFRLTLIYSLVVFAFCGIFVLAINMYVTGWVNSEPPLPLSVIAGSNNRPGGQALRRFADIAEAERARIREFRIQDMLQLRQASLISLFPIAGASFIAGYLISGRMLKPLSKLNKQMEQTDSGTLGNRILYTGPDDEIGKLISTYNGMAERLAQTFELQEQFIQNASHELKTPMAIIHTNLESVVEDVDATPHDLRKAVKAALTGTANLNKLVEDLLTLSLVQQSHEPVNLGEVINSVITTISSRERRIVSMTGMTDQLTVNGNRFLLERAFSNLLDNALKHADSSDPFVEVEIKHQRGSAVIRVTNNGDQISPRDLPRVFERFYRAGDQKKTGFGLGLSISSKVIRDHEGSISAESENGLTSFTVTLPLKRT